MSVVGNFARRLRRTVTTWTFNTISVGIYVLSGGKRAVREGHFQARRRRWTNWSRTFAARPARFEAPATLAEICQIVREAAHVRPAGGGHSFNGSPLCEGGVMLSLDSFDRVVSVDTVKKTVTVQAGMRLHALASHLAGVGLALPVLGSHDRQSIGGLIATDLHGTGRQHGFLSEQVLALEIVDAQGVARTVRRGDNTFHAAFGAVGTCGVVTQVELQCVPAFNLAKSVKVLDRHWVSQNIQTVLAEHDHVSFYYVGGVDVQNVRMNVWDRTDRPSDTGLRLKKMWYELLDMAISGYALGIARALCLAGPFAALGLLFFRITMHNRFTVYPSASGFSRTLFYHHDEIECGVAYEKHQACLEEVLALLRKHRFVAIVEVRFTPDTSQALIGPGAGRRTCFIEIAPSLSLDNRAVFAEAEAIFRRHGARPHLGKKTSATRSSMEQLLGANWARFREVQAQQDPTGKFQNDFTRPIFAPLVATDARVLASAAVPPAPWPTGAQPEAAVVRSAVNEKTTVQ